MNVGQCLPAVSAMVFLGLGVGIIGIFGFFVEPLSREFGVGVAVINMGPVALLLMPGLLSPLAGKLADSMAIRRLILIGIGIAMGSLFAISLAPSLLLVGFAFICFTSGLVFYGPVVVNGLMVKLYPKHEARALAIAAMGISLAGVVLPTSVGYLLEAFAWRDALSILSITLLLVLLAAVWLGVPGGVVGKQQQAAQGLEQVFYRRSEFWLIGFCVAMGLNVTVVSTICLPGHFTGLGFSIAEAGWFISVGGLTGFMGKSLLAWRGDRIGENTKWLVVGVLVMQALGYALLVVAESTSAVFSAMALIGFSSGVFIPMHAFLNSRYFDAAVIGQVTGAQMPLFLPFGLIGAPLAGYVYDVTASYHSVLLALVGALCIAAIIAARLPAILADARQ